jgi:hypothetical protein
VFISRLGNIAVYDGVFGFATVLEHLSFNSYSAVSPLFRWLLAWEAGVGKMVGERQISGSTLAAKRRMERRERTIWAEYGLHIIYHYFLLSSVTLNSSTRNYPSHI